MKKTILALLLTSIVGITNAGYTAIYKPDPNSIVFNKWTITEPLVGDWIKTGDITGCTNWTPSTDTYKKGDLFTQKATDCKQTETSFVQEQEKDDLRGSIRVTGKSTTETRIVNANSSRQAIGTKAVTECNYDMYRMDWWKHTKDGVITRESINYNGFYSTDKNYALGNYVDYGGYRMTRGALKHYYPEDFGVVVYIYEICRTKL